MQVIQLISGVGKHPDVVDIPAVFKTAVVNHVIDVVEHCLCHHNRGRWANRDTFRRAAVQG